MFGLRAIKTPEEIHFEKRYDTQMKFLRERMGDTANKYATGYTWDQLWQIRLGLGCRDEFGVKTSPMVEVEKYDDPIYNWRQMAQIRIGMTKGINVDLYRNPEFSAEQMIEIRIMLEAGLKEKDLAKILDPSVTHYEMRRFAARRGIKYVKKEMTANANAHA